MSLPLYLDPETTLEARLRRSAGSVGSAAALLDGVDVRASHADLRRIRDGGRQRLRDAGVRRTDHVALVMSNTWELAAAMLAVTTAGAAAVLDPGLTDREMVDYLTLLAPAAILVDAASAPRVYSLVGPAVAVLDWSTDETDGSPDNEQPAPEDVALLLFTSGTTAAPKVVQLSQRNLAAAADSIVATLHLGIADRALNVMSLHHGHGIFPGTLAPLVAGGATACTRVNDADELATVAAAVAPTWYSAAPVVHHSLLAMARANPLVGENLNLRVIRSTSSALAANLLAGLERCFSAPVVEAYALSEAPGQIASNPLHGIRRTGTVGRPQGTEIAVLTMSGAITDAPGSTGEVLVRGPVVMPGYLGVSDGEQPFLDGWLRTGDHAHLTDDGYVALVGRTVDVISRGAEKFSPLEVEKALAEHPAVAEVAVFGRAHPTLGAEAAAAVVLRPGACLSEHELIAYVAERVAAYKVPVQIEFMAALPRGRTGKIVRRRLAEQSTRSTSRSGLRITSVR